jgi:hypothetical protein
VAKEKAGKRKKKQKAVQRGMRSATGAIRIMKNAHEISKRCKTYSCGGGESERLIII